MAKKACCVWCWRKIILPDTFDPKAPTQEKKEAPVLHRLRVRSVEALTKDNQGGVDETHQGATNEAQEEASYPATCSYDVARLPETTHQKGSDPCLSKFKSGNGTSRPIPPLLSVNTAVKCTSRKRV